MLLEDLSDEAIDLLADYCGFQIAPEPNHHSFLHKSEGLQCIASDGMGGY